jgi:hypothetical protein
VVEGTCNAQASDDRNWIEIQVLERRLQTVRPEGARFALHVIFACDYVITGEGIRQYLEESCPTGRNKTEDNLEMISTLCGWWDEWAYAWGRFPGEYAYPRKQRANISASLQNWLNNHDQLQSQRSSGVAESLPPVNHR